MLGTIVDPNIDPTAQDTWAIVIGTTVVEMISASYNFVSTYTAAFDYAVDITVGGQSNATVGYIYDSGSDSFSQPVPPLGIAKAQNIAAFQSAMAGFVSSHYTLDNRFNLLAEYQIALANGLTNRAAYIFQIFTWANSCMNYVSTYVASIMAMTDASTVLSTLWNFDLIATDPAISPIVASQIPN